MNLTKHEVIIKSSFRRPKLDKRCTFLGDVHAQPFPRKREVTRIFCVTREWREGVSLERLWRKER